MLARGRVSASRRFSAYVLRAAEFVFCGLAEARRRSCFEVDGAGGIQPSRCNRLAVTQRCLLGVKTSSSGVGGVDLLRELSEEEVEGAVECFRDDVPERVDPA